MEIRTMEIRRMETMMKMRTKIRRGKEKESVALLMEQNASSKYIHPTELWQYHCSLDRHPLSVFTSKRKT